MNLIEDFFKILSSTCVVLLVIVLLIVIYRVFKIGILLLLDKFLKK